MVCPLPAQRVQLSVSAGIGRLRNVLWYRQLMPIMCHFHDVKHLIFTKRRVSEENRINVKEIAGCTFILAPDVEYNQIISYHIY